MDVQCLIVDDEVELAQMTQEYFEMFGVSCACCTSGRECLAFLEKNKAKLILLDINLVEESGFTLCKKIRETSDVPILFISARDSDSDVLIALNIGGDDYIKKPYSLSVLLAKVQVVLKRMGAVRQQGAGSISGECAAEGSLPDGRAGSGAESCAEKDTVSWNTNDGGIFGEERAGVRDAGQSGSVLRLAEEKFCAYLKQAGQGSPEGDPAGKAMAAEKGTAAEKGMITEKEIPLKAKEFALLKCLYEHRGTIVTKEQLFVSVWGDAFYSDGTLNVHIRRLREKLEEDPSDPKLIKTIWGTGYMLEV